MLSGLRHRVAALSARTASAHLPQAQCISHISSSAAFSARLHPRPRAHPLRSGISTSAAPIPPLEASAAASSNSATNIAAASTAATPSMPSSLPTLPLPGRIAQVLVIDAHGHLTETRMPIAQIKQVSCSV
jgi:hypothetical protein